MTKSNGKKSRFQFKGSLEASKSLFIRGLLVQSYFPQLKLIGTSTCDDVRAMMIGVASLIRGQVIDCQEAGTVIRFLSLRASREKGKHQLTGSQRLLSRPLDEIPFLLSQLGVSCHVDSSGIEIESQGWKAPVLPVQVRRQNSSQFASSLLLNAWDLPFPLTFHMSGSQVSEGYWEMSVRLATQLGMRIERERDSWVVPPGQKIKVSQLEIEPDYSSMFAVAAAGALLGEATFTNVGETSLQPDFQFFDILRNMGVPVEGKAPQIRVSRAQEIKAGRFALTETPDLFPVLAVLCCFSSGMSDLVEAPQLAHKESNRLAKTKELLKKAGVRIFNLENGIQVDGAGRNFIPKPFDFDPDQDHRMAMAAGLLKKLEPGIRVRHPEVVGKSFPGFWQALGIK